MKLSNLVSSQKPVFSGTPAKPIVSSSDTHVEHSRMMSIESHSNNGSDEELVVLKTIKGKGKRNVWNLLGLRSWLEVRKMLGC